MNIALLGYAHPFGEKGYYGAERIIYYLAQELKNQGHNCVIFAVAGCNLPDFDYVILPKPWDDHRDIYFEAVQRYEKQNNIKFDIVHSFQASGYIHPEWREKYYYCLEPFMRFTRFFENIIAYSRKLCGLNGGQSTTIYFGIPEEAYPFNHKPKDYLAWIGRMDPGKAPHNAIEIAKRANKRIVLIGPPYNYPYFVEHIWPQIDNDRVIWLGGMTDKMKAKVLRNAIAFINPIWNNYQEMFGIVNIEALACGTPVIGWNNLEDPSAIGYGYDYGYQGEIIKHGEHGFIINHNGYSEEERQKAIDASVDAINEIHHISRGTCRGLFTVEFTSRIMTERTLRYYSFLRQHRIVYNITNEIEYE